MAHDNYDIVQPGQVGQVLGPGGAAGDVLERLEISVTDATTCEVSIKDGGGSAITVLPETLGAGIGAYSIPLGAPSKSGPWSITAGLGSTVKAVGSFSRKNQAGRLSLPGTSGDYASTPDSAAVSITGDIDIRVKMVMDDWTPADTESPIGKWDITGNQRAYRIYVNTNGRLSFEISSDGLGGGSLLTSTAAPSVSNGNALWIRITIDVNDGAGNKVATFYTSSDGISWTALGSAVTEVGTASFFDSTASVEIGSNNAGTGLRLAGKIYYAEIRNGIDGTVVAKFDPREGDVAATTFTSGTGEVWTINQSGSPAAALE